MACLTMLLNRKLRLSYTDQLIHDCYPGVCDRMNTLTKRQNSKFRYQRMSKNVVSALFFICQHDDRYFQKSVQFNFEKQVRTTRSHIFPHIRFYSLASSPAREDLAGVTRVIQFRAMQTLARTGAWRRVTSNGPKIPFSFGFRHMIITTLSTRSISLSGEQPWT